MRIVQPLTSADGRLVAGGLLMASSLLLLCPRPADAAAVRPGAGSILQQVRPKTAPAPSGTNTGLRLAPPKEGPSASKTRFLVRRIAISGNTLFGTDVLHGLVASGEGKKLTLGDLERLAARISNYYHVHGYSLSRAVIPAQTITDGVVRFEVVEARFGRVSLANHTRVRHGLLRKTLSPLKRGAIVSARALDHALLLLSDIPGVAQSASLMPGAAVGSSDLDVVAKATPQLSGYLSVDNHGSQYTGRARAGGGITIVNPLRLGDELTINVLTTGKGLDYGRTAYDVVVNGYGTRMGGAYSQLHYVLGGALSSLDGYGTANVASAWVHQPLLRGLGLNLYAGLQFDEQRLRDHIDSTGLRTDRHLDDWTATFTGDARDRMLLSRSAVTSWRLGWTSGRVTFDDPIAAASDAATARTAGDFSKWTAHLVRAQGLGGGNLLKLAVSGQWTPDNLDSAQKLVVGGPYSVRAYDTGILSADSGYLLSVELHHRYDAQWQTLVLFDHESVSVNAKPWSAGDNHASLSGAGLGVTWDGPQQWRVNAYAAWRVGSVPTQLAGSHVSSVRGWVQIAKTF